MGSGAAGSGEDGSGEEGDATAALSSSVASSTLMTTFEYTTTEGKTSAEAEAEATVETRTTAADEPDVPTDAVSTREVVTTTTSTTPVSQAGKKHLILRFKFDRDPPSTVNTSAFDATLRRELSRFTKTPPEAFFLTYDWEGDFDGSVRDFNVLVRDPAAGGSPFKKTHLRDLALYGRISVQRHLQARIQSATIVAADEAGDIEWTSTRAEKPYDLMLKFGATADIFKETDLSFFEAQLRDALAQTVGGSTDDFEFR